MFGKRLSLLYKSLIWINSIAIVLITGASILAFQSLDKANHKSLEAKVSSLAEFVKHAASSAVWNFDAELLKKFTAELTKDPDIVAVEFLDKDNKALTEKIAVPEHSGSIEKPILDPKGESTIGYSKIYFTNRQSKAELKQMGMYLIGFAIGFQVILSVSVSIFLGRSIRRLEHSVEMLKETATQASSTGINLKTLSANISEKGSIQAAAIEETSATLTEISSILTKTVEASTHALNMANTSHQAAENGKTGNEALFSAMKEISDGAKKIQEITGVVDDIAFQTNLLALNAAVEAARAGEQGRGFAVVAEAVRNLAQKSAVAAKDISNLITESTGRVENGMKLVQSNSTIFSEILTSVQSVREMNATLAQSSQEQAAGISQITKAVSEIDLIINDSARSTQETAREADQMAEQSELLNKIVQNFETEIKGQRTA